MPDPGWESNSNVGVTPLLHPNVQNARARLGSVPRPHIIIANSSFTPNPTPSSLPPLPSSPTSPSQDSVPSNPGTIWNASKLSSPTILASTSQSYFLGDNPSLAPNVNRNPPLAPPTLMQDLVLDDVHLWVSGRASLARVARRRDRESHTPSSGPIITMSSASNPSTSSLGTTASASVGALGSTASGCGGSGGGSDDRKLHTLRGERPESCRALIY